MKMKSLALSVFLIASSMPTSDARLNNMRSLYRIEPAVQDSSSRVHAGTIDEGFTAEGLRDLIYEEKSMPWDEGMSYPVDEVMPYPVDEFMSYPLEEGMSFPLEEGMSFPCDTEAEDSSSGGLGGIGTVEGDSDNGSNEEEGNNDRATNPTGQTETSPTVASGTNNTPKIAGSVVAVVAVLASAGVVYRIVSKKNGAAASDGDASSLSSGETAIA